MMKNHWNDLRNDYLSDLLSMVKIGIWDWDLQTGRVIYSSAWAEIFGYTKEELPQRVETWESMVLPEDLTQVNKQIEMHIAGEIPVYEAEFRMVCKDGSIIWTQDKGKITEYSEDGKPLRFVGVLQNISPLKKVEEKLHENQEALDIAVHAAELGTWDWDIPKNTIKYNKEYLDMLGYSPNDIVGSLEEWEEMNHPEDLPHSSKMLMDYVEGKIPKYQCETRMRHKNGSYVWTRDVGRIFERDENGKAVRVIGGHLNIDALKRSEERFIETLAELEHHKEYLEKEIDNRTKTLTEQDKMLWAVNDISRKLFSIEDLESIYEVIQECVRHYCNASGKDRISLWKNNTIDGQSYCSLLCEYSTDDKLNFSSVDFEKLFNKENIENILQKTGREKITEEILSRLKSASSGTIPYGEYFPTLYTRFMEGKSLNSLVSQLTKFEGFHLHLQGVKSFLVTPIILNNEVWGFIDAYNCQSEELFSEVEERMLSIVGFFLANTIQKNESEKKMREAEERIQLMLDATPLCCNLWTRDFKNMSCNEEAARLFELPSQQDYLDRFSELSPKYQPCGRLTSEMIKEYVTKAFEEGFCKFQWMHQKLDGTPIPAEVTYVRIKYKGGYIVAGYTRDLRELNTMLAKLREKENDLRSAMEEALLSSKAKTNFLANMSHEIRTPMNAISGFAEIILRESRDKQSAEYAVGIKNACGSLLNIINDILDISKIESGKLEIINSQYELSSLLNDVITISRMRLGDKPIMFITNIDSKLPSKLIGDEIRIKQILINLLSNAIKFTEKGHIALRVFGEMKGDKAELCFQVSDTGFGIKAEDLNLLFAEFERVNTTKNRSIEGTGLGLAISKQLCEMMGGKIYVESTYGKGSIFTMRVVQECPEYERIAMVQKEKTVLLYESRDVYLNSIVETIENLDCKCIPCTNQSQLYDNINLMHYDCVFTSSMHLRKIKKLVKKNVLHTSVAVFADYGQSINDDSAYTMTFPVNCLQMADMLNGQKDDDGFGNSDEQGYSFIAPTARVLVVDDNEVNLKVATGLMLPYQFIIDTAENGIKAVEMVKKHRYDLVFMDHMMPEMDGIDATIEIRQMEDEYYQTLPIIALTANALVGTREMFIREGMNDFLSKPVEVAKMGNILAKWIPKAKKVAILPERKKQEVETLGVEVSGVNIQQGILSVGGSKYDYLQILASYYVDANNKRATLLQHFANKDILAFRTEVHALKSTSATIGAAELAGMARDLEMAAIDSDIEFIDSKINKFLNVLQNVIDAIEPLVGSIVDEAQSQKSLEGLKEGTMDMLQSELEKLHDAAEFADLGAIEDILDNLNDFSWQDKISEQIANIKKHLAMFDYDGIIECIILLRDF